MVLVVCSRMVFFCVRVERNPFVVMFRICPDNLHCALALTCSCASMLIRATDSICVLFVLRIAHRDIRQKRIL
jgi:hypothetical protein